MWTRHFSFTALLVIIVLAFVVWALNKVLFPLVGSWVFYTTDEHYISYLTQQQPTQQIVTPNTPFLLDYYYRHTTCAVLALTLFVPLAICISILISRSYGKIPIDLTHIYTSWNQRQTVNKASLVATTPIVSTPGGAVAVSTTTATTATTLTSSAIINEKHFSVHSPVIAMTTETTPDMHNLPTQASFDTEESLVSHSTKDPPVIDKRKKKRPKKKERGKRDSESVKQKQQEPSKVSIKTASPVRAQQPMIIVPPTPQSPRSVISTLPMVTQKPPIELATSTNNHQAPPSPAVSPKESPPLTKSGSQAATTSSPPHSLQQQQQPMITKLISNKKEPLVSNHKPKPPPSTCPPRQSWYSPFNTGLEFDLLSRSPPPTNTTTTTTCLSSPSSSSSVNQNDYRLFSDSPRIPSSTGGYNYLQQQQHHQPNQQHHMHQQSHHRHHNQHNQQQQSSHIGPVGSTLDYLVYGTLPKPSSTTTIKPMESSSSIADLPPPTPTELLLATRLPTPPVSLSPVIAPPSLPSSGEKSTTTFPFSLWYPWKPWSGDTDQEGRQDFSLFDRKLSFHSPSTEGV
ncbi:hypothetical protein BC941DRAFT_465038 [Chlamydoabsidia padenii]|nr:hypothetical protein BC941DRAFT_465038 [Chlamydoabsidia padenii]